ncbi:MAG: hypothetical protein PHW53_04265 [Patescibacteria group bacterium]|nr:hypothetical protein [Patescibacteria group bacterium]
MADCTCGNDPCTCEDVAEGTPVEETPEETPVEEGSAEEPASTEEEEII